MLPSGLQVTRVTKVTTTRSIKQVPVDPADIFFDAEGNPVGREEEEGAAEGAAELGIDLSRASVTERSEERLQGQAAAEATPGRPPRPEAVLTADQDILLSWQPPSQPGQAGELLGYLVEFRRGEQGPWESAHDELLVDTDCRGAFKFFRVSLFCSHLLVVNTIHSLPILNSRPHSALDHLTRKVESHALAARNT